MALLVTYGHQVFTAADSAPARPNEDTLTARFQLILKLRWLTWREFEKESCGIVETSTPKWRQEGEEQ